MGRFQKPDSNFDSPLSNPQGWNLYSYVKGNPVNFNDPTGHYVRSTMQTLAFMRQGLRDDIASGCNVDAPQDEILEALAEARLVAETADPEAQGNPTPPPPPKPAPTDPGVTPPAVPAAPAAAPAAPTTAQAQAAATPTSRDLTPTEGQNLVDAAAKYAGTPYKSGGDSKTGIDCSHLVSKAAEDAHIPYEYVTTSEMPSTVQLRELSNKDAKQAGDLVLFPGHVGLYDPTPPVEGRNVLSATRHHGVAWGSNDWFPGDPTYYRIQVPE
jgi:cell wall-associated NlpC family hydrolase